MMKQAKLTREQIADLYRKGYTFTKSYYYWTACEDANIANRITRAEFMARSIAEPLLGVEQVRIYERLYKGRKPDAR
jgi:hypothetical protein